MTGDPDVLRPLQSFAPQRVEVLLHTRDNLVARYGNIAIQIRRGELTDAALSEIQRVLLDLLPKVSGPIGAVAVVEAGAEIPAVEVRRRQSALIRRFLSEPQVHVTALAIGQSTRTKMVRSIMRLLVFRQERLLVADDVPEAVGWLAPRMQIGRLELAGLVRHARDIAARAPEAP